MRTHLLRSAAVSAVAALALSAPVALADVVVTPVNQRVEPGPLPEGLDAVMTNSFALDLNGDGVTDATLDGQSNDSDLTTIPGLPPKIVTSSTISLSDANADLALRIVAAADAVAGQPAVPAGTVIGGPDDVIFDAGLGYILLEQERETTLETDGSSAESFDTFGPFADFANPAVVDADGDGLLDGPLFIGFALMGEGDTSGDVIGPANFGFLQFDQIDSAADVAEGVGGEFESALTLVGFAYETTPDTWITTFDLTTVPEPTLGLIAGLSGLIALRRRR